MFYERFLQICEQNKEKPTQVLKEIGASSGNLSNWKSGGAVKSDILLQISKHFNVSIDYLLGRADNFVPETSKSLVSFSNNGDHNNNSVTVNTETFDKDILEIARMIKDLPLIERSEIVVMINKMKNGG